MRRCPSSSGSAVRDCAPRRPFAGERGPRQRAGGSTAGAGDGAAAGETRLSGRARDQPSRPASAVRRAAARWGEAGASTGFDLEADEHRGGRDESPRGWGGSRKTRGHGPRCSTRRANARPSLSWSLLGVDVDREPHDLLLAEKMSTCTTRRRGRAVCGDGGTHIFVRRAGRANRAAKRSSSTSSPSTNIVPLARMDTARLAGEASPVVALGRSRGMLLVAR